MNELFNKINNPLFHVLRQATNEMCQGQKISRQQLQRLIKQIPAFQYNEAPEDDRELSIINKVFRFTDDTSPGKICFREPVPPLITAVELSWLKSMLQDDRFAFLLAEGLRNKLLSLLAEVEPLFSDEIWQGRPKFDPALSTATPTWPSLHGAASASLWNLGSSLRPAREKTSVTCPRSVPC